MITNNPKIFKILLVGNCATGKTAFIEKHLTNEFIDKYDQTDGVLINSIELDTTIGKIICNCWDISSKRKYNDDIEPYIGIDASLMFISLDNRLSLRYAQEWAKNIREKVGNKPIILVGNKFDREYKISQEEFITLGNIIKAKCVEISVKTGHNINKPLLYAITEIENETVKLLK